MNSTFTCCGFGRLGLVRVGYKGSRSGLSWGLLGEDDASVRVREDDIAALLTDAGDQGPGRDVDKVLVGSLGEVNRRPVGGCDQALLLDGLR